MASTSLAWLATLALAQPAPNPKPLTVDDMLAMERIAEIAPSPDGAQLALTIRRTDVEANRGRLDLWVVPAAGGEARALTSHPDADTSPAWAPDGKSLYFLSSRGGSQQIWRLPIVGGGEAVQVTQLPLDVGAMKLFPDGKRALVTLEVYADASIDETVKRQKAKATSKSSAQIYDELLFRHWDTWEDGLRNHLFVIRLDDPKAAPIDLTAGLDADVPTRPFGDAGEWAISPDGKTVVFTMRSDGAKAAWSTNTDLYAVPSDGSKKPENLTADNLAQDAQPVFSPDGKTLAYLAMARPKYESDRQRITLLDVVSKKRRALTEGWDRSPHGFTWSADGKALFANADDMGNVALFRVDAASGLVTTLVAKGAAGAPVATAAGVFFPHDTLRRPVEVFFVGADGQGLRQVTRVNDARVAAIQWSKYEQFSFAGAKGDKVHGFLLEPAQGLKKGQKVPLVLLIHGGPQGSFGDHFHYRWNPMAFAARGKAVAMIDFHGSTGYGQAFTDAINHDWGGAPYEDIMKGVEHLVKTYGFIDGARVGAAGASYGGYMINWINGNTDRFKALVCHDGNLDERMAYFDTEELWFPEWEHGGTPWENPEGYAKHNPIDKVAQMKTPTLVIHGGKDFRVVDTQGMSTFTALRRRGVPARFVFFPDENHWVLKPQNSQVWHREVLDWLDKYLGR